MTRLQITVLGSATPYPQPDNPCSGYLVSGGGSRIWLDAGTGTLAELQRHTALDRLDAIWISHLHADHAADLLTAYYAVRHADIHLERPIPLYGPPGTAERLARFLTNGPDRAPVEQAFEFHELHNGHEADVGALRLRTISVAHGVPAFGVRVEYQDRSLVYSGDSAPCERLTDLAADCDLLLCEADGSETDHHTPEQAGETARGAGRLLLTHVGPGISPGEAVDRAAGRYEGRIDHASPGLTTLI